MRVPRKTRIAFDTLVTNPAFLKLKEDLFKSIPELKSFSITDHIGVDFLDLPIFKVTQILLIFQNTPECNLHRGKVETSTDMMLLFQYFNCCLNQKITDVEDPSIFAFLSGKQTIISRLSNYPSDHISAILIPLQTSKTQLITWIGSNWPTIAKSNKQLPKFGLDQLPKNLLIGKEIADLKDTGITFFEITNILFEKYPNDKRLFDEAHVKTMYNRYMKYLANGIKSVYALNSLKGNTKT